MPINQYQEELNLLKQYAKMESREDINNFELLAWKLAETKDTNVLAELFKVFDDDCPYLEVMWTLLHAVESYDRDIYIKTLLLNLYVFNNSTEWCYILFCGILNHPPSLKILSNNLYVADKNLMNQLFDTIYRNSEKHKSVIKKLRLKLNG